KVFHLRRRHRSTSNNSRRCWRGYRCVRILLLSQSNPRHVLATLSQDRQYPRERLVVLRDDRADRRDYLARDLSNTDLKCVEALTTDYTDINGSDKKSGSQESKKSRLNKESRNAGEELASILPI